MNFTNSFVPPAGGVHALIIVKVTSFALAVPGTDVRSSPAIAAVTATTLAASKNLLVVFSENFALLLRKPIQAADLKGFKIRTTPLLFNFVEKLGGAFVTMSFSETYLAIQKGVVDGALLPIALTLDAGLHEVAKYAVMPVIPCVTDGPILANAKKWDALPANVRAVIMDVIMEMEPEVVPFYKDLQKKLLAKMWASGAKPIDLPPAEASKYVQTSLTAPWAYIEKQDPEWTPKLRKALESINQPKPKQTKGKGK
jgi:TRAP-type C4-dicarboxylate transport system substrate-binding protein